MVGRSQNSLPPHPLPTKGQLRCVQPQTYPSCPPGCRPACLSPVSDPAASDETVTSLSCPKPAFTNALTNVEARFWRAESSAGPCGWRPSAKHSTAWHSVPRRQARAVHRYLTLAVETKSTIVCSADGHITTQRRPRYTQPAPLPLLPVYPQHTRTPTPKPTPTHAQAHTTHNTHTHMHTHTTHKNTHTIINGECSQRTHTHTCPQTPPLIVSHL
jgi:hypothetical protein